MMNDTNLKQLDTSCPSGDLFEAVVGLLSAHLWTFITFYLLLLLIHYLRYLQQVSLYDRCTPKNAHFRYDFHVIVGRYSANYSKADSHLIVDLLDNQLISAMTIQVPGSTLFNENQVYMYEHMRSNMRCISFYIYRRHPIKDIKSVRVAHSCSNPDSRLFIYGINLYDSTNGENRFFPITSIVKYRGTRWALNTSFEPRGDVDFSKMGCDTYDPFGTSIWPTYVEYAIGGFLILSLVDGIGYLLPVQTIGNSIVLHSLSIGAIVGFVAGLLLFVYFRLIKIHIVDLHYESWFWYLVRNFTLGFMVFISILSWVWALGQAKQCKEESHKWLLSSVVSSLILCLIFYLLTFTLRLRKRSKDAAALEETDTNLMKTNSKKDLEFTRENPETAAPSNPPPFNNAQTSASKKASSSSIKTGKTTATAVTIASKSTGKKPVNKKSSKQRVSTNDETLDNAFANSDGVYIKTKNRNSISQYI